MNIRKYYLCLLPWLLTTSSSLARQLHMDGGFFYWGTGTEQHHYIYLLTENIGDQRLEGKTPWSSWTTTQQTMFSFPQKQGFYGVVGAAIPYSGLVLVTSNDGPARAS